jgi:hypothetical protein
MMKWMIKKNKVFLAMIILLLALLCIGWEISLPYRTPVLVIGTQEIFSDEWQEFLQQQKSAVTVYYTQNYGCTVFDDAFWSTEYDGQTPLDCARNRALDTLIDNCVVLRAAQERDLIENIDLRTLKKEWKGFNKQRESSVSMNSVMYGPIEYSFENYYRHLISNLRNSLEENLIDEDPLIEEAAQEFYGENLNQFTTSGNTHVSGLLVEGSHASAYQLIQEAQRAIREGMSFENACTRYATSGEEERFQFTSLSQKADIHGLSTIYTLVLDENIVAGWATERIAGIELQKAEGDTFTTFYSYEGTIGTSCELTFEDCSAEKIRLVITSLQPDTSANSQGQTDPSLREVALYYKPESTN